jgi:hypothetical protein
MFEDVASLCESGTQTKEHKMPGPVPKRSDERIRRNIETIETETIEAYGEVIVPPLDLPFGADPMVVDFYESIVLSGYSKYYEPSDWQHARLTCFIMQTIVTSTKPSAEMYKALQTAMSNMLVTEGDRRRLRIEIQRDALKPKSDDAETAAIIEMYAKRMEKNAKEA